MKNKKIIIKAIYIIIALCIFLPNTSKAVLQANGGTPTKRDINTWLLEVRQMQQTGGALGLTDTVNNNLTTGNKNLDIHMEKNTEYGAMAILSASNYGKQDKVNDGETTTGNSTGIKINININTNQEWTSSGCKELGDKYVPNFGSAVGRYKNIYTIETTGGKVGDAIATVGTWHGAEDCRWLNVKTVCGILRNRRGSLFSYYGSNYYNTEQDYDHGHYSRKWHTRAVVVCGSGV